LQAVHFPDKMYY